MPQSSMFIQNGGEEERTPTSSHLTHIGVINGRRILEVCVVVLMLSRLSSEESLEKVPEVPGVLPVQSFRENEYQFHVLVKFFVSIMMIYGFACERRFVERIQEKFTWVSAGSAGRMSLFSREVIKTERQLHQAASVALRVWNTR